MNIKMILLTNKLPTTSIKQTEAILVAFVTKYSENTSSMRTQFLSPCTKYEHVSSTIF